MGQVSGLDVRSWGPGTWALLHAAAHAAPAELNAAERAEFEAFLWAVAKRLPCPACSAHFQSLLEEKLDAAALANREAIVKFVHEAHNEVSVRLGKRAWTLEEHYAVYYRVAPAPRAVWQHPEAFLALGVAAALAGYWVCRQKNNRLLS